MSDLDIKSETIDKAIDVIADSTKETRNALDTNSAKGINKFFELLKSTPELVKLTNLPNNHLEIQKMKLVFTDSGKKFIDICLS